MDIGVSTKGPDEDAARWCCAHIGRIAAAFAESLSHPSSLDAVLSSPAASLLISQFATGHRPNTIFLYWGSNGVPYIDETIPRLQDCVGMCLSISRTSATSLNTGIPWGEQIVVVALPHASVIDSLYVTMNRSIRPLIDHAVWQSPSSKNLSKAQSQLTDLCSTLRHCIGSKRAVAVDFDRALMSHGGLKEALSSSAADALAALLSGEDRQAQEDVKAVLLEWTADMRKLEDVCKETSYSKLSDLEQHVLSVHSAVSSTLMATNNPQSPPLRFVDVCQKQMDRDSTFRILCRMPKANYDQARLDLSARAKAAEGVINALRDLKLEVFLSCNNIASLRQALAPMIKILVERGRENSSRSSQSAEFMLLLSYDVYEKVCSILEHSNGSSLLLLPRDEFKASVGLFIVSDRTRSTGCDRLLRDWFEHCQAMINDSVTMTRMLALKDVCCPQLQQLEDHLKRIAGCYKEHHQLLDVLNKIISSNDETSAPSRPVIEAGACVSALKKSFDCVARLPLGNMEYKQQILEAIERFSSDALAIEDRLAVVMNEMLRPAADRKRLGEMFAVFSSFAPLLERPKIRGYVQNYQHVLFSAVQDSVSMLLARSLNSGSQAEAFASARGLTPIATHVVSAGQIIRRLESYRSRLQQVMGKDWEKTAGDLPKKIANFALQASPESEVSCWIQEADRLLKSTLWLSNPLFHSVSRGGRKTLSVNFDQRVSVCVREGLMLQALGYASQLQAHTLEIEGSSVAASVWFFIMEIAPMLPVADSLSESLKRFSDARKSIDSFSRVLLAEASADVFALVKDGTSICWNLDTHKIKPFAKKLATCVQKFIQLSEHARSLCSNFHAAINSISSSTSTGNVAHAVSSLDHIVQDVELGGFSNTQYWIQEADTALERALVCNLSSILRAWSALLSDPKRTSKDQRKESSDLNCMIWNLLQDVPVHHLNMTLKGNEEVLVCSPPVSESTRYMVSALNGIIASFSSLQRLMARTIKKSLTKKMTTYSTLMSSIPQQDLSAAYSAIMDVSTRAEGFVEQWQSLQALWTSNPSEAAVILGTDLEKWRSVLSDIRSDRAQKNSSDSSAFIGPLKFDFSAAQSKVVQRYDLWSRSLINLFTEQLISSKSSLLSNITAARDLFESLSTTRGIDVSLKLLVAINEHDGCLAEWQSKLSTLKLGEDLVFSQDDGRARLLASSVTLDHIRGALYAFEQIFAKRKAAVTSAKSVLQQHVLDEYRESSRRYHLLLNDWDSGKPDHKSLIPVNALEVLCGFKERCEVLCVRVSKVAAARSSLGVDATPGESDVHLPALVLALKQEMERLEFVWESLSGPYRCLFDLDAIQLPAVSVPVVRSQLESARTQAKALDLFVHDFAAYRGLIDRIEFRLRTLQMISDLKSPAIQARHWQALSRSCSVSLPADGLSLGFLWDSKILQNDTAVKELLSSAQGEFALQEFLDSIQSHWTSLKFDMYSVGRRALNIKGWDILFSTLSDHMTNMASMKSSPYFNAFQEQANIWEDRLFRISQFMDAVVDSQRKWIYLEGIFGGSGDIQSQLPLEANRFKSCDAEFVACMHKISRYDSVFGAVQDLDIKRCIDRTLESLNKIQKGLSEYLESKRGDFPRFYFVGDEDLLELLGNSNDILRLQQYLRKMFAGISFLKLNADSGVVATLSPEGEVMPLECHLAAPSGRSVSLWLDDFKASVTRTLRAKEFSASLSAVLKIYRRDSSVSVDATEQIAQWMDASVCQALIVSMQVAWTTTTTECIGSATFSSIQSALNLITGMLSIISNMAVRPVLDQISRKKCEHCIFELVHQRDVLRELSSLDGLCDPESFFWLKNARFCVEAGDLFMNIADGRFSYGWEYLGVIDRLVYTDLTDRCYLTLAQAIMNKQGGAPFGPAGTGKTETVKSLSAMLGRPCIVFNCDASFDVTSMGRIFSGLCQTGAWGCFDEFNRLEERVLSAVSQQIVAIQMALRSSNADHVLELNGRFVKMDPNVAIFVTMNLGYAGRAELPDNLKQLFRGVAMTKPDSAAIAEITLFTKGFCSAESLAGKVVDIFESCRGQLSSQKHYDFGLRALKSVLFSAGAILRDAKSKSVDVLSSADEERIISDSFKGSILPKLLKEDAAILLDLLSKTFIKPVVSSQQDADFNNSLVLSCETLNLFPSPPWIEKILQIKQLVSIHHGIMLVGPSGTGKSAAFRCLLHALDAYTSSVSHVYVIDPKSIKKEELYGKLDINTREWSDGVFTAILRRIISSTTQSHRHWIVFDGDLDPDWVETLNSVLDDNKTLTLPNGERLELLPNVRVVFEVRDIGHGTPATVSRCGMVWFAENIILVDDLLQRFVARLRQLPYACVASEVWGALIPSQHTISDVQLKIASILEPFLSRGGFLSAAVKLSLEFNHIMPIGAIQACSNVIGLLLRFIEDVLESFPFARSDLEDAVQRLLCMAAWWGLCSSMFESDRQSFSSACAKLCLIPLPTTPVIDMFVSPIDFSWKPWSARVPFTEIESSKITEDNSLIPTVDTLRHEHIIRSIVLSSRSVLLCGPPGSGKSMSIISALSSFPEVTTIHLSFSSSTQPSLIMRALEHNCTITRTHSGLVMRPNNPANRLVLFCDEVNLPSADAYGTQTAISLLRQILQFGGFWRAFDAAWIKLERVQVVAACNPSSDNGRNALPDRFLRHVLVLHVDFPSRESIEIIYGAFTRALMRIVPSLRSYAQSLCLAMVELHFRVTNKFTRSLHDHYVFSPRDLSRWIRGIYEIVQESEGLLSPEELVRFWAHEALRLYGDRLVSQSERDWLGTQIDEVAAAAFVSVDIRSVLMRPILYSRWASRRLVSASMRDTAQYIEQRFAQFQEEEYDVKLVAFDEFVDNCLRLDRVLRQPIGHALLIGSAGVGKTVISRFVSWMNGFSIFQIKAHKGYSEKDFQEDLRSVMKRCGCNGERVSFIVDESNILSPSFLEMMNALLASGCIPGLFVGDELSKLLQACRESVIVKGTSSAGDGELLAAFHDSVRRHLHVIFTMNPATAEFNGRSASSPAMFNRCVINWIGNWSHKSFQQVCCALLRDTDINLCKTDSSDNNKFKVILAQTLVSNHQCALEASRLSCCRFAHFSPRQFVDVISQFMALFQEKKDELDARQLHLISGLTRLLETECALATLQGQLREKNDELIRHNTQAEETLADMLSRQQEAEGRRMAVEQLALEVKEKQAATELRKLSVESRLKEVEPAVFEAQSAVRSIKKAQLDELRVMASPPAAVKTTLEAICTLLYGAKSPTWDDIRKFIRRDDFISGILDFDAKEMLKDTKRLKSMRAYFDDSSFNFENVNRSSKACGPLVKWMESQVMFAEVLEQVEPLRGELSKLNMDIETLFYHKEAALSELQQLQSTITSCKQSYAMLISSVQTTKVEIASVTDKLSRSTQLIQSLESERRRWQIQQESFAGEQLSLLGDAVVCSCFCVYSGCFDQEQRAGLLLSWIANAERCGITVSSSLQPFKCVSTAGIRLQWTQKGLPSDDLCAENACIMERSLRPSLAIDPSDIAGTYVNSCLKSKDNSAAVTTTFNDASFVRQLENCLRFGTPLIISDVVTVDPILFPLLNREFRKTGGRCLVRLGQSEIDCSPSFSLLMVSRSSKPIIGPDISSRITLVNFTITQSVLQSQIMSMVLKHQRPEIEQQLHQLDFFKSQCRGRLVELEDKLLGTLSDCQGSLLDNDSVITALQTLKSQSLSIVNQLADAEGAHEAAAAICATITPLAHFSSVLFFELQRLRQLKPYYVMSLLCFTNTVRGVVLQQPKDLSGDAVKQYTLEIFKAVTSDVLMWVLQDDRLVACFIIARVFSAFCDQLLPEDEQVFFFSSISYPPEEDSSISSVFGPTVAAAVCSLSKLSRFLRLKQHILDHAEEWKKFASCSTAPLESPSTSTVTSIPTAWMPACLPAHTQIWLGTLVARCFSPRLALNMTRQWLHTMFSIRTLERETPDVSRLVPEDSRVPLLLLSSAGFDMGARVAAAASSASCDPSLNSSPLLPLRSFTMGLSDASGGSTQSLDTHIVSAAAKGGWVLVTNVHLAATAVLALQKKVAGLKLHPSFRLILTAEISHADSINQSTFDCSKIAVFEAPRSLRDVFLGSLFCIQPFCAPKPIERARVLLHVAWLHSVVITRLQYVPDGWTKRYEFNETDLCSAARIAGSWIDRAFVGGCIRDHLPLDSLDWTAIATLTAETVYGGRIDNEADFRVLSTMVQDILRKEAFSNNFVLGRGGREASVVAPETCLNFGNDKGGAACWARECIAVVHDPCWIGLPDDADAVVEGRILSAALHNLQELCKVERSSSSN